MTGTRTRALAPVFVAVVAGAALAGGASSAPAFPKLTASEHYVSRSQQTLTVTNKDMRAFTSFIIKGQRVKITGVSSISVRKASSAAAPPSCTPFNDSGSTNEQCKVSVPPGFKAVFVIDTQDALPSERVQLFVENGGVYDQVTITRG